MPHGVRMIKPLKTPAEFWYFFTQNMWPWEYRVEPVISTVGWDLGEEWTRASLGNLNALLPFHGAIAQGLGIYADLGETCQDRILNALLLQEVGLLYDFEQWEYEARR